ncbi:glycoside hydrolase family 13 protein [Streptomyces radicis]|uniref:Glycoside hydrolase family 13 protein n=1 Tax=Streptomyces radicis TaxID=1750517 RepID=A0A3A9WGM2_9ACTN|nr:glycoside hydrolase family 13 protein [Streptomyces radicis]RKN06846.1 glycoside hydrolase family 13 protein [Streptomyces radicis]RKN19464.1 glycoside hydrolase family 13 protein [Streptomyces radicis]
MPHNPSAWWRTAAIYQVYPRSFADGDGDGTGDLAGVRARLPYLAALGVEALWFTPWYVSPLADGGYDVADYRAIDPAFGTLDEAEKLISEARQLGLRTIVDVVPNHVSDEHAWFRAALDAPPGSSERELFHFRPGRGPNGDEPPNAWRSEFGGPAWSRTEAADGAPGEWYLHLFAPGQPDLNWAHPRVRREHEDILRFWFDRGAAGIRIDSAALLAKAPDLPDFEPGRDPHPYVDRDELHDIYRSWRSVADAYDGVLIGELWLPDVERFARYLRPDELHTAFNFDFLSRPWAPDELRASIDATLAAHAGVGAPATWVLCNHDVTRTVTRYGRAETGFAFAAKRFGTPTDLALGTRRARAAALLTLALPGAVYIYQGEELGLPEAEIPRDRVTDPMHDRSGGVDPGRDGCRVPLPWEGERPPYGFGGRDTWLPQPADWAPYTAARQENDPDSMLSLYRTALRLRRGWADPGTEALTWLEGEPGLLAFARADGLICAVNLAGEPVPLPAHTAVLLSSGPLDDAALLPPDTAAWLRG